MLSELKKIEKPAGPLAGLVLPENLQLDPHKYASQIEALGEHLDDTIRTAKFQYRDHKVLVRGIQEDFRVFLDDKQVCECVYGNLYNINEELFKLLVQ